jgi:FkbM family methyltransferase
VGTSPVKGLVRWALLRSGYHIEGVRYTPHQLLDPLAVRALELDDVICRCMFEAAGPWSFIQVGAFDGVANDPLRKFIARGGWRGVMLEPQVRSAARLRKLYSDRDEVLVLEAALDSTRGRRPLFTLQPDGLPEWAAQIASFDRQHLLRHRHLIPQVEKHIQEFIVECVTFDDVLAQLPDERLDLLQMDAEGADGYLLPLFPFERMKPAIVHWEIKHMTRTDQEATIDLVRGHGYRIARSGREDMLAVLPSAPADR